MANWATTAALGDPSTPDWQAQNLSWIEPIKGQRWQVYKPAATAFEGLLNDLIKLGYHPTSSGGYNYRNIRGSDQLSQHAFGTAIDLNSMTNPMGQSATDIPHAAELAKKWGLEWGGDWKHRPDPMHFEYKGQVAAQMSAAGYTPEQIRNALASIESAGSGDYKATGVWTGDPEEGRDRAYGRYQIMGKNIDPWMKQYLKKEGVTPEQFLADPALQDQLTDAVMGDYVKQYGLRGAFSKWYTGSENEPNRTDPLGKLTGKTYVDKAMAALGGTQDSPSESGGARFGGGGLGTPDSPYSISLDTKKDRKDTALEMMAKAAGNMGQTAQGWQMPQIEPTPAAARVDAPVAPVLDPQQAEYRRQMLAQVMARLNNTQQPQGAV